MTTFRQIEANRRNARKSTGRVTEEGKRISAAMPSATVLRPSPSSGRWRMQKTTKRSRRPSWPTMMLTRRWSGNWCCG
jgi:hypothetical protein